MNLENIKRTLEGQPAFRYKQVNEAIFSQLISDWSEATGLPAKLRQELTAECPLYIDAQSSYSEEDRAIKALIKLSDSLEIETVLMKHRDGRNTVCVSSQVGCPLGCLFCATGQSGFRRSLTAMEIVEQVLFFARQLKLEGARVTNVVFMGMGEPFLNYDNVIAAVKILNNADGMNIGARHISISSVGLPDGIKKLAKEELQVNLAISLHAPNDKMRSDLMPINKRFSLRRTMESVKMYMEMTNRRVMFEYILLSGVNDFPQQAKELVKLLSQLPSQLYMVNLVPYNNTGAFEPSEKEAIREFQKVLEAAHVGVTVRHRFGNDIDAACGQLARRSKDVKI